MKKVDTSWKNILPEETHTYEHLIVSRLNERLFDKGFKAYRVESDPYSATDIHLFEYDPGTLVKGNLFLNIDVERKTKVRFPEGNKIPSSWSMGVNLLRRKVDKPTNRDEDVYLIFDNDVSYPRIIWVPFGTIRKYGEKFSSSQGQGVNDVYILKEQDFPKLNFGCKTLVDYILNGLQETKVVSPVEKKPITDKQTWLW